jgi:pyruvate dehydrogenase E1 component
MCRAASAEPARIGCASRGRGGALALAYCGAVAPEALAAYEAIAEYPGSRSARDHLPRPPAPRLLTTHNASAAGRLLAQLRPGAALVTVADFHPATLSRLGAVAENAIVPLGVDRFGQSGDIPDLYRAYSIDTDAKLDAAARACLRTLH